MNDSKEYSSERTPADDRAVGATPPASAQARFYQRTDWLGFTVTTVLVMTGYLLTLAPGVTLELSGIFSVGAMYAGVPHPPGYPLWTLYAWVFTALLPFSNIAWRVAVSSAVAGALACGMIALMVSRGGAMIVDGIPALRRHTPKEEKALRVVSGLVAGAAFGFDGCFWRTAVVVDPWPMSMLLFSLVLCLLLRWIVSPDRRRYLYAASLAYGLAVTNSQALLAAALGLQILVTLHDRPLGRDILCTEVILLAAAWAARCFGFVSWDYLEGTSVNPFGMIFVLIAIGTATTCAVLTIKTRGLYTRWKTVLAAGVMFLVGVSGYLYLPIASMTNPPVNWGYSRTVEGFLHTVTRGQYERVQPTDSVRRLVNQIRMYGEVATTEFGPVYVLIAPVPFCFLYRMRTRERRWVLGLLATYGCLGLLFLVVLNQAGDRHGQEFARVFYSASHLVLATFTGYGLILLGFQLAAPPVLERSGLRPA